MSSGPLELTNEGNEQLRHKLNSEGFLLEDKTWKILSGITEFETPIQNAALETEDNPLEIDVLTKDGPNHYLIECKKTQYSWFFPKAEGRNARIHTFSKDVDGLSVGQSIHTDILIA